MNIIISDNKAPLAKYLPSECIDDIYKFIIQHHIHFRIVRKRIRKLGDYLFLPPDQHKITINNDLNPYHFLFVTLHEFAHLKSFQKDRKKIKPHGKEWKHEFGVLIEYYIEKKIFPPDLEIILRKFMRNPSALSTSNAELLKGFQKYNTVDLSVSNSKIRVEDIPINGIFQLKKMIFKKIGKRRTRYTCESIPDKRIYLVHGLAEVELLTMGGKTKCTKEEYIFS